MLVKIKPVGAFILVRVTEPAAGAIQLLPGTQLSDKTTAVIEQIGTRCSLGLLPGQEVEFKASAYKEGVIIDKTETETLVIVPEISVLFIKNYSEKKESDV